MDGLNFKMMILMKKLLYIFSAAALLAVSASCNKDQIDQVHEYSYKFNVAETELTKAVLGEESVLWEDGDVIGVFAQDVVNAAGVVEGNTFSVSLASALAEGDVLYFYYPYSQVNASATAVALAIPAQQSVSAEGVYDCDAMPQVGKCVVAAAESTMQAQFSNLASVVEFHVFTSAEANVGKKIKSLAFNASSAICGELVYDITAEELVAIEGYEGMSVVTALEVPQVIGSSLETATVVPMVVAPGTYRGKVVVTFEDDSLYEYDVVNDFSIARNALRKVKVDISRASTNEVTGDGTEAAPYKVYNQAQLAQYLTGSNHVELCANVLVENWVTPAEFSGVFDGKGNTISGLTCAFIKTINAGTVKNVRFVDVNMVSGIKNSNGLVAELATDALVSGVAVYGNLSTFNEKGNGDTTGFGGIAGRINGTTVVENCYVAADITILGEGYCVGGIVGTITYSDGVTIDNCTFDGTIKGSGSYTKIGGILGRKTNNATGVKDIISDCLVSGSIEIANNNSNMVGGVFGALQGSNLSDDYVGGLTVVRTAFTGKVSAGNTVGGIGGVCCSVTDCFVSGTVQSLNVLSNSTGGTGGVVSAAKGDVQRCVVAASRVSGTNNSSFSTAGIISKRNGNTPSAKNCVMIASLLQDGGKTILGSTSNLSADNNYWYGVKYLNETDYVSDETVQDGTAFAQAPTQSDFVAMGYDFTNVWKWNAEKGYPELAAAGCAENVK